jgi:arylsulfate sulfotransferase
MKTFFIGLVVLIFGTAPLYRARAGQADDTTITIIGNTPGVTPFISQVTLNASDTSTLKGIQFTVAPKAGSVIRPLSGNYARSYLMQRGFLQAGSGEIHVPVYGLYAGFNNTVTLRYYFNDGSSSQATTTITTASYAHPCGLDTPTALQARTNDTTLSYDYMLVKGGCPSGSQPVIVDTDGALRWVAPTTFPDKPSFFFDSAIYQTRHADLYRLELDGTITLLHNYQDIGVTVFDHNIDFGKSGMILEPDTAEQLESVFIEIDKAGNVLKRWDLADVISKAMIAGGDDPSQFVYPFPRDWFHSNAVTYNRADDSVLFSSRESFVICLDYKTGTIKWILGDKTKKWYQFPSLAKYALTVPEGSLPPIGQHSISITYDQHLLLFDNGSASQFQMPPGENRSYTTVRKYRLDLNAMTATEVWNYDRGQTIMSPFCGSIYEDAPLNYVIDYAMVGFPGPPPPTAHLLGLDASGKLIFAYQYPTFACNTAYNTTPLHLENTAFPPVGPQALNLSTRGMVGSGANALIGGFIVTGNEPKTVVLRALGPSLSNAGLSGALADPVITLYDASGSAIATNDNWGTGPQAAQIAADGLAPSAPVESALRTTLAPAAYTAVVTGKNATTGLGLVEIYDLSPTSSSKLANISTRGTVGTGDTVLISGFILGQVQSSTVILRVLGPTLASFGIANPLSDPILTVYNSYGTILASNNNWQDDPNASDIQQNGLAPANAAESAIVLHLPAGAYTTLAFGANGSTGVGLVEVFNLP